MKKTKVIIPALGLLLLSTAASVTGTVAWFAANGTVSATGMEVKAKSDSSYLQIQKSDVAWSATDAQTTIAINNTPVAAIKPTHVSKAATTDTLTAYDGGTTFVLVEAFSNDPAAYAHSTDYTTVATANYANYALKTDVKIRLKPDSGATSASDLKVTDVTIAAKTQSPDDVTDGLLPSLRAFVLSPTAGVIWKNGQRVEGAANDIISATIDTTGITVSIYVYFDGEDSACYTNNALTPDDYTVSVTFAI